MFKPETRILIVDDMMTMRKLVKKSLTALGFSNFEEAADGQQAWVKLNQEPRFDLVISDWNMPNCTGIELLKKVRSDTQLRSTTFVLLTAEAETHQVKEALQLGVDNYVIKPFTTESLKEKLEQVANRKAA
jgi:two-component system chemotaxis response regulator CheY